MSTDRPTREQGNDRRMSAEDDWTILRLAPAVQATRAGEHGDLLAFWCQHCGREHTHGRCVDRGCPSRDRPRRACTCPVGSGDGHRAAHCHRTSPFRDTGYVLREIPEATASTPRGRSATARTDRC